MSLETLVQELSAALKENTAEMKALRAGGAAPGGAAPAAPAAGKPAAAAPATGKATNKAKAPASKYTLEQVVAKAVELKDTIGRDETVKFINVYGAKASKDLKPEMWDAFVADVDERIADEQSGTGDEPADDDV